MRGSQRVGMSTKKDAARPFGLGTFFVVAVQDENRDKQRQGITIMGVSCLLIFLTEYGILSIVRQIVIWQRCCYEKVDNISFGIGWCFSIG